MSEIMNQVNGQMEMLPLAVQYWMNWMGLVFLFSIVFVWKKKAARYVLLAMLLPMLIGLLIFYWFETVHLMGVGHLLVWIPLFYYLLRCEIPKELFTFKSLYGVWMGLLMGTIAISVIFDIRDVVLVLVGSK
jgi:hypothetical protein